MGTLSLPQGHGHKGKSVSGRAYPVATRPPEAVAIPRPVVTHTGIAKDIDDCLRKMQEFKNRHEQIPSSFYVEYAILVASLGEQSDED